ncbi:GhoT/OrtT family toxin [Citrobacter sp. CtB7.12]|uniref:GhoT/OrtT family toxin n=1 Tax=Citrobacter sp. CtB7.12 TaxID=1696093 RepID=UPI00092F3760|nr:GhoT/OrtT family toxin [Citrobacter sp. CtB7.12]
MNTTQILFNIYVAGFAASTVITFLLSKDQNLKIRWLAAILIGLTWPLNFPV